MTHESDHQLENTRNNIHDISHDGRILSLDTVAVVAGRPDTDGAPLNEPLVLASNFRAGPEYNRTHGNRTWEALEKALGAMEGGDCVSFASGMAAASAILYALRPRVVLIPTVSYLGVRSLLQQLEIRSPIDVRYLPTLGIDELRQSFESLGIAPRGEGNSLDDRVNSDIVVWIESPANPTLEKADVAEICDVAREFGVTSVVDSTFATPVMMQPLHFGATVVMHSGTKFIGGHSDLLIGLAVTNDAEVLADLHQARTLYGATPGALESFLALRGVRTLPLRYRAATENARQLADRLVGHEAVTWVRQVGPMVSFIVHGGAAKADAVCASVRLIVPATSLGGVETTLERRQKYPGDASVDPGLIRMSVGIEDVEDIWSDIQQALQ